MNKRRGARAVKEQPRRKFKTTPFGVEAPEFESLIIEAGLKHLSSKLIGIEIVSMTEADDSEENPNGSWVLLVRLVPDRHDKAKAKDRGFSEALLIVDPKTSGDIKLREFRSKRMLQSFLKKFGIVGFKVPTEKGEGTYVKWTDSSE